MVAEGAPAEVVTAELVEEVFGLRCLVVPDPVTGTPLVVPLGRGRTRQGPPATRRRRVREMADPLVEKLSTGEWSPERFRRHLEETGAPLVERVAAGEVEVTFVDEPGDDTTVTLAVVIGPNIGFNTIDTEFTPVAGTPFRVLTLRMRSDLRFSYVFGRRGPTGRPNRFRTRSIRHRGSRSARWRGSPGPRWQCCRMRCRCPGSIRPKRGQPR